MTKEALISLIDAKTAWAFRVVPEELKDGEVHLFCDNPDQQVAKSLQFRIGRPVKMVQKDKSEIDALLARHYRNVRGDVRKVDLNSSIGERFVESLIEEAKRLQSSDIHVEIFEEGGRVRIRVDGHLLERYHIAKADYPALINRIKIRAGLDIAEKRLPQDGRISFKEKGNKIDIRVSIVPTLHGEKAVMRLLNNDATNISIDAVGLAGEVRRTYEKGIRKPSGIVLISGPTGSGKTTTLYATLKELNLMDRNIMTVEDPIEYTLKGINQVQLKENIGLTFSAALRTFLRQDPDVIMLGEIRDEETAEMSIRSALTGHLVLSTIHTPSALDIVSRLTDLGVQPFLIATTVNTLVAQRLVRKLCSSCCKESEEEHQGIRVMEPVGCEACYFTGYKGRVALFEVIEMTPDLQRQVKSGSIDHQLYIEENNIQTLRDEALRVLKEGLTSVEEIMPYI